MACNRFFVAVIVSIIGATRPVAADSKPVTLVQSVELSAIPDRGYVAVSEGSRLVTFVPAAIVIHGDSSVVSVVGRVTLPVEGGPFKALFTVFGKTGEVSSAVREISDLRLEPAVLLDTAELKRRLGEQKEELHKWDSQVVDEKSRLKKVQDEADSLSSVGRIVDADEELLATKNEGERLDGSLMLAKERQIALKTQEPPPNFKRREGELSTYLNLLSTELKAQEGSLAGVSAEFQDKRDLVEATKYEHIDLLKDELAQLRRKREALERSGPQSAQSDKSR